jgi:hypothetical protein
MILPIVCVVQLTGFVTNLTLEHVRFM